MLGLNVIDIGNNSFLGLQINVVYIKPMHYYTENVICSKQGVFGIKTGYGNLFLNCKIEIIKNK